MEQTLVSRHSVRFHENLNTLKGSISTKSLKNAAIGIINYKVCGTM